MSGPSVAPPTAAARGKLVFFQRKHATGFGEFGKSALVSEHRYLGPEICG